MTLAPVDQVDASKTLDDTLWSIYSRHFCVCRKPREMSNIFAHWPVTDNSRSVSFGERPACVDECPKGKSGTPK